MRNHKKLERSTRVQNSRALSRKKKGNVEMYRTCWMDAEHSQTKVSMQAKSPRQLFQAGHQKR